MRGKTLICLLLLSDSVAGLPALGQSLDYGPLERIFDEPVTTSATGKPERVSDTPVTMDVITAEDIQRSGARDIATLLRALPGVLSYRGYNGTEAFSMGALLLNGREVYLASFDETFLSSLPVELEEIRQIEVIRGPQSALYGFNSGQGVVNIITFDPAQDDVSLARVRVGNDARRDGAIIATGSLLPGVGVRLTADSDHAHDQGDIAMPSNVQPQNPDRRVLSATVSALPPDGDHAGFAVSHSDVSLRAMVPEITEFYDARLQSDAVQGDYAADTVVGRIGGFASFSRLTVPQASTEVTGAFTLHDHTFDAKLNDLFKAGPDDNIRLDAELRDEDVRTTDSTGPITTRMIAGSAMWDHQLLPGLSIVNAVRYSVSHAEQTAPASAGGNFVYDTHGIGDNSALIYKVTSEDTLRAAFSRGLALPSQLDFAQLGLLSTNGAKFSLASYPDLQTTEVTESRLSWDHDFRDWAALGRISLFESQNANAVSLLPLQFLASLEPSCLRPTIRTLQACETLARQGDMAGGTIGAELQLDHKSRDGLTWGFNYSVEQLHPHATQSAAAVVPDLRSNEIFHKVNANLGYGWEQWTADIRLFYSSPVQSLVLATAPLPGAMLAAGKDVVALSPHLAWSPRDYLTFDLAADNLWGYKEDLLQRAPVTYFLSLKVRY